MTQGKRTSVSILLLSAVLIVGVACSGGVTPETTDTTGTTAVEDTFSPTVMTADVETIPGDSLWAYVTDAGIWSDSVEADRFCAEVSDCNKQLDTKKVKVRVWAHKAAKNVHDSKAGARGTLVAKMENIGDAKERMYGLEPNNVYLVFIYPGNDTSGVYRLVPISKAAGHRKGAIQEGTQIRCNHPGPWPQSWATFASCADGRPTPPSYITASKGFSLVKTAYAAGFQTLADSKPLWITCPSGCCTSGPTQTVQLTN